MKRETAPCTTVVIVFAALVGTSTLGCASAERSAHEKSEHGQGHARDDDRGAGHPGEEGAELHLSADDLARLGITAAIAGPGSIDEGVELLGEVHPNGDRLAHITPRFPGIVREVRRTVGDRVETGDVLAVIESSESLAPYDLKTLIAGTVIEKHLTRGEAVDRDRQCFVIADLSTVWLDLSVYQRDLPNIRLGQPVRARAGQDGLEAEGTISYVTPGVDRATRTATARVVLANPDGRWRPGMFVTALALDPAPAPLTIPSSAVQMVDGKPTAFALEDGHVELRALTLGRRGETTTEVLAGLSPGERVAATNSFLLKAELEKSEAEHEH